VFEGRYVIAGSRAVFQQRLQDDCEDAAARFTAGYRRSEAPRRPTLDAYVGIIDEILCTDKALIKKQRHTAKSIFERLRRPSRSSKRKGSPVTGRVH
jgi:hypothetical protein